MMMFPLGSGSGRGKWALDDFKSSKHFRSCYCIKVSLFPPSIVRVYKSVSKTSGKLALIPNFRSLSISLDHRGMFCDSFNESLPYLVMALFLS